MIRPIQAKGSSLLLVLVFLVLGAVDSAAQERKRVEIIQSAKTEVEMKDGTVYRRLSGNVILKQDDTYMYCDRAIIARETVTATGNVQIKQGESVSIKSNQMFFNSLTRIARANGNVALRDGEMKLDTETLNYNLNTKRATYPGSAVLTDGETILKSNRGNYNANTGIAGFADDVDVEHPEFGLQGDTMTYDRGQQLAKFYGPTDITLEDGKVNCNGGKYNLRDQEGEFIGDVRYRGENRFAKADTILYVRNTNLITLIGDVSMADLSTGEALDGDYIEINRQTKKYTSKGAVEFYGENQSIRAKQSNRNKETGALELRGDVFMQDGGQEIKAAAVDYFDDEQRAYAKGEVHVHDKKEGYELLATQAKWDRAAGTVLAWGDRPYLIIDLETDSLYISADTLEANRSPMDTAQRDFHAIGNVRLYSDEFQGACGKLYYSAIDSTLRLIKDPVIWSTSNQFMADTVLLFRGQENLDRAELRTKAMIIESADEQFFNQIAGKQIDIDFDSSKIKSMDVVGNAQVIFYAQDDAEKYIGVNRIKCSRINFFFDAGQVSNIRYYSTTENNYAPMVQTNHKALELDGFQWLSSMRPIDSSSTRFPAIVELGSDF